MPAVHSSASQVRGTPARRTTAVGRWVSRPSASGQLTAVGGGREHPPLPINNHHKTLHLYIPLLVMRSKAVRQTFIIISLFCRSFSLRGENIIVGCIRLWLYFAQFLRDKEVSYFFHELNEWHVYCLQSTSLYLRRKILGIDTTNVQNLK